MSPFGVQRSYSTSSLALAASPPRPACRAASVGRCEGATPFRFDPIIGDVAVLGRHPSRSRKRQYYFDRRKVHHGSESERVVDAEHLHANDRAFSRSRSPCASVLVLLTHLVCNACIPGVCLVIVQTSLASSAVISSCIASPTRRACRCASPVRSKADRAQKQHLRLLRSRLSPPDEQRLLRVSTPRVFHALLASIACRFYASSCFPLRDHRSPPLLARSYIPKLRIDRRRPSRDGVARFEPPSMSRYS